MRTTTHFAAFGLFTFAAAEALPPSSIPLACATICAPIVDLSRQCAPLAKSPTRLINSDVKDDPSAVRPSVEEATPLVGDHTASVTLDHGALPTTLEVDMWREREKREEQVAMGEVECVCANESFDFVDVLGKCLGCVEVSVADFDSNVKVMMSTCGLELDSKQKTYTKDMDALVGDLKVRTAVSGATSLGSTALLGVVVAGLVTWLA